MKCPNPDTLSALRVNALTPAEDAAVTAHLDSCATCQTKLDVLNGPKWLGIARTLNDDRPGPQSAFARKLQSVQQEIGMPEPDTLEPPDLDMTSTQLSAVTRADREFNFLEASDDPAHLGKLDRFDVEELIGRGGMGIVFRATDTKLSRKVAIKVLDPQFERDKTSRGRFEREARAAAGLSHENVVTIHHVESDCQLSYIVMQLVAGESLQDLLDVGKPFGVRESVRIAAAMASGLAAAHSNGLIHRDIKPGNILIERPSARVLLTDFGLARTLNEDLKLTQTGFVAGTPLYMSPEQARGDAIDARSDLFSLGSVLYAMLAGVPPFPGTSAFVVLRQVTDRQPRPIQDANHDVPDSLAEVLGRLMEKSPARRFHNAADAAQALNAELARLPADAIVGVRRPMTAKVRSLSRRFSFPTLAAAIALFGIVGIAEATKLTRWTVIGQRGETPPIALAELAHANGPIEEPDTPLTYMLPAGDGAVWAVAFDPCGDLLATATEGGSVKFWDAREGNIRGELNTQKHKSPVWGVAFNRDGTKLVTASDDGSVRLWDVQTKQEASYMFEHPAPVRSVAFSPDGKKLASGTRTGTITIWNPDTGKPIRSWVGHDGGVIMAIAYHKDGKLIATAGSDKTVKLWDADEGTPQATLSAHSGPVYAVAFDPMGRYLASAGWDRTIRLWDVNTTQLVKSFEAHKDDVWSLAFCPAGKHLVTGGQDRTAKWLDIETSEVKQVYRGHAGPVHGVAVSKDGKFIASGGRDGTVRVWSAEP